MRRRRFAEGPASRSPPSARRLDLLKTIWLGRFPTRSAESPPFLLPRHCGPWERSLWSKATPVRCREHLGFTVGGFPTGAFVSNRERLSVTVVYETLGGVARVVLSSAARVTAVGFAWYPSDADPDAARQTRRCKPSDLGQESEVTGSSTGKAEHQ